jgi:uncharacterized NAD(P)/FAD-binding protein YdhS
MQVDIAVIGGGFSAVATVINVLDRLGQDTTVALVSRKSGLGRGVAYSTTEPWHRLNVPAGRMSLLADKPDHLCEWLAEEATEFGAEDFIPRQLYGRYLQETLADRLLRADNSAQVWLVDAEVLDCEQLTDEQQVYHLSDGQLLHAKKSIFCIGGTPAGLPVAPEKLAPEARSRICLNVWSDPWMEKTDPNDEIVMLGSGLTMIDQVLSLKARRHQGRIQVISRHGLTPLPHRVPRSHPVAPTFEPGSKPLSGMMKALREAASKAEDWRAVVDGLRPITQALWQNLSTSERARFLRHANAWWSIHRHRLAPDMWESFSQLRQSGQVSVAAGWLREVYQADGKVRSAYFDRHSRTLRQISSDWLINCTGMDRCSISKTPLLKKMSSRGMIRSDVMGLGLAVDQESRLINEVGEASRSAFALGPMTVGQFFEIFAVPDIRVQAAAVAGRIAKELS